jgi:hypothetical protein
MSARLLRSRPVASALLVVVLLVSGCAFGPGEAFGEIDAVFGAELERRGGRFTEAGALLPVGSWEVRLDRLNLEIASVRLLETGTAGSDAFDPAKPPPGWYCHAGHCHTPDDDLVSYDEAALIIAGGPSGPRTFVRFPVDDDFDLLSPGEGVILDDCDPDCVVGRGAAGIVGVSVSRIRLEGEVRDLLPDGRLGALSAPIHLDLSTGGLEITTRLEEALRFDRGVPPLARLDLDLLVHPSLLDGVAFDTLVDEGEIHLNLAPGGDVPEAATAIFENLEASRVRVDVERLDSP